VAPSGGTCSPCGSKSEILGIFDAQPPPRNRATDEYHYPFGPPHFGKDVAKFALHNYLRCLSTKLMNEVALHPFVGGDIRFGDRDCMECGHVKWRAQAILEERAA